MNWGSAQEFFHMGGYGFYVWGSYIVALAVMLLEPLLTRHRHQQALRDAALQTDQTEDET
jgi:heme exporter protein D